MKVLVTGGNGLLGHNIIQKLIDGNHKVRAIVRNTDSVLVKHNNIEIYNFGVLINEAGYRTKKGNLWSDSTIKY